MAQVSAPACCEHRGHGRSSTLREVIDVQKSSTSPVIPAVPPCAVCAVLRDLATDPTYGAPDGPGRDGYMLALEHVEMLAGGE
jgi:hypothetical protein